MTTDHDNFSWPEALRYVFRGHKRDLGLAFVFYLLAAVPFWANPVLVAALIDLPGKPEGTRFWPFVIYATLFVVAILFNYPMAVVLMYFLSRVSRTVGQELRIGICRQLQQLTILYHGSQAVGPLQSKAIRDIELIETFPRIITHNVLSVLIVLVAALIAIAIRAPQGLWFFILLLGLSVALQRYFRKRFREVFHNYRSSLEVMTTGITDMLTMIPVTRAHGLEEHEIQSVSGKIRNVMKQGRRMDMLGQHFGAAGYVAINLNYAAFIFASVAACIYGKLSVGDVVMFSAFFMRLSGGISGLLHTIPELAKTKESILSIREVLEAPDLEENAGKLPVPSVDGRFEFQNVSFCYPGTVDAGVHDLSLNVAPGESVALVGPSGCGKSTTLSLLLGFVRPQAGAILLDGRDMAELDLRQYRQFVGVVTQETVFFSGTIRDNVAYGRPDIDDARVIEALEKAQAMSFVNHLPDGIDTRFGAEGLDLSGGQRQRLSIARAFVRDPRVLIFDEATSALDVETEHILQDTMQDLMRGRTSFLVSHRLSTIRHADRIIVMEDGMLAHDADHAALVESENYYARAVRLHTLV